MRLNLLISLSDMFCGDIWASVQTMVLLQMTINPYKKKQQFSLLKHAFDFITLHHLSADKRGQHFTNGYFSQHVSSLKNLHSKNQSRDRRMVRDVPRRKHKIVAVNAESFITTRKTKAYKHAWRPCTTCKGNQWPAREVASLNRLYHISSNISLNKPNIMALNHIFFNTFTVCLAMRESWIVNERKWLL